MPKANSDKISLQDLYRGIETAVALVDKYGESYWPIFERLETEIDDRESRAKRLDRFRNGRTDEKGNS